MINKQGEIKYCLIFNYPNDGKIILMKVRVNEHYEDYYDFVSVHILEIYVCDSNWANERTSNDIKLKPQSLSSETEVIKKIFAIFE